MRRALVLMGLVGSIGCDVQGGFGIGDLSPPRNLTYTLEPSGTPGEPAGVVLRWDITPDDDVDGWNVYGRSTQSGSFSLRATTTSTSFHDDGEPELEYFVTALGVDGNESDESNTVLIDERLTLDRPSSLVTITLNGAVAAVWTDNAYQDDPEGFSHYRVYSALYDLDDDECANTWRLEGSTVAPEFRVGAISNGVRRCFAVSGISIEGFESLWSPIRSDTPRPDARNVMVTSRQSAASTAGFRFWTDANGNGNSEPSELGRIGSGNATDQDFVIDRDASGRLWMTPIRQGTEIAVYGNSPVGDLTDIDLAPLSGYARSAVELLPGWGYVFKMSGGDGFLRFGALRATHVGRDVLIFDWSFQTDPGNPELLIGN